MILFDTLEVFNVSPSCSFVFSPLFSYRILKMVALAPSGASYQHNLSNDQSSSGDSNSPADRQKVFRRVLPGSSRNSPVIYSPQHCQHQRQFTVRNAANTRDNLQSATLSIPETIYSQQHCQY